MTNTLEEEILFLQKEGQNKSLSVGEISTLLVSKGRLLLLMLLSLPFCQPIQIPGLAIPFGLFISFLGLRMTFGKGVWLPKSILSKNVSSELLVKITDKALVIVRKLKPWIYPRLDWLCCSSYMKRANGLIISFLGILLAMPLPIPLSNLIAAWSIFLIALGLFEDDGLFILLGYLFTVLTTVFFVVMVITMLRLFS